MKKKTLNVKIMTKQLTAAVAAVEGQELFEPSGAAGINNDEAVFVGGFVEFAELDHLLGVAAAAVEG
jgi:hypothetical protein